MNNKSYFDFICSVLEVWNVSKLRRSLIQLNLRSTSLPHPTNTHETHCEMSACTVLGSSLFHLQNRINHCWSLLSFFLPTPFFYSSPYSFFPILEDEPRPYQTDTIWLSYISNHLIIFSLKLSLPKLLWLELNCYVTKVQIQLVFWLFFITSTS